MSSMALALLTLGLTSRMVSTAEAPACRPIKEIYANGQELCEVMWDTAFKYETNEEDAYTMWFFDMNNNPNSATSAHLGHHAPGAEPDTCNVQYLHKTAPGPEGDGFTECHPWKENACCHDTVVESYIHLKEAYGAEYHWDRCGPLSQECERFFVQEACFYECEPNVGYYKKYENGVADDGSENHWQLQRMPIKASYCDAWYTACADDYFCGSGDYFACAREYEAADAATSSSSSDDGLDGGVLAVIIVGAALLLLSCVILVFFVARERAGRPVFAPLMEKQASPGAGGQQIGNSMT